MSKFIAFDTETGGTLEESSLLTVFFAILDDKLNLVDSLSLALKPNNGGSYVITPEAMAINKINLLEHDKVAVPFSDGGQQLVKLLKQYSDNGKDKLIPLGHNVHFDIDGVCRSLLGRKTWNQFVSYRVVDTQIFARCLQIKGVIPITQSISLGNLVSSLNVDMTGCGNPHEAKYDTLATIEVLKELLRL